MARSAPRAPPVPCKAWQAPHRFSRYTTCPLAALPGVVPWPSEANFITIDVTATGRSSTDYVADARAAAILLRRMSAHRLEGQYVRVTIGTKEQNRRFLDVFTRGVPGASPPGR